MRKNEVLYKKDKTRYIIGIITFSVLVCIYFLSVGYSAFSNTLGIEGILATVRPSASARITDVSISSSTNGGFSNSEEFTKDIVLASVSLPNNNSTVTYKVDVTVFLSSEMKITNISGSNSDLDYTISGYNIGDILCDSNNQCNLGATTYIYVTVGYKNGVNNTGTNTHPFELNFTFETVNVVAKIGDVRYETLQDAVDDVPTNNTETIVHLLKNTTEVINVLNGQNITFNLHGNTIKDIGTGNIIINSGIVRISDGILSSTAYAGVVNNNSDGTFIMSGGTINATGKQAVYNDGGVVSISGGSFKTTSSERATIQNQAGGTMTITGGSFEATRFSALENHGTMTIGVKDGNVSNSSPSFTGSTYGINSDVNYNFYDGVVKGFTAAFNNENKVTDKETGLDIVHTGQTISGKLYDVARLGTGYLVTFNSQGGTPSAYSKLVEAGQAIGKLPEPTKTDVMLEGWYDDPDNGTKYTSTSVINSAKTLYAHWIDPLSTMVARIGDNYYNTLQAAVNAVSTNGTEVTIKIINDTSETVKTKAGQKIKLDIGSYTLSNKGNVPIIENYGTLTIYNGNLTSNATQGAINNKKNATLYITGGTLSATGTRQVLYNDGGTATISGGTLSASSIERAVVHNLNNGKLNITGGTITSSGFSGLYNASGTVTIGEKDGNINTSSPVIQGLTYGVDNGSTFKFYDGILKGVDSAINGNVNDTDGTITNGSETIGNDTYITAYLE